MKTKIITIDGAGCGDEDLLEAARILREGGLVAFPTETVYGLGANALMPEAAQKTYAAKGRPSDNPLIVHIAEKEAVYGVAAEVSEAAERLMDAFWPGPMTLVLKKADIIPKETTGGLDTVAVRMPSHPVANRLIRLAGVPVSAPSANLSGHPSPTEARFVIEDLDGRVDVIIDGGPVDIGLESTIIDLTGETPTILRPGYITRADLEQVTAGVRTDPAIAGPPAEDLVPKAPGMKYRHYAPKAQMTVYGGDPEAVRRRIAKELAAAKLKGLKTGVLCAAEDRPYYSTDVLKCAGRMGSDEEIARNLFRCLREFDEENVDVIFSESFRGGRLEDAIMNRLMKAAGYRLVMVDEEGI
ncbi:MAG: threonylcarbamoyl-AMP synthase [Lachnospiraceae bacterium]|nr:threonylcarbamoyl-AMP synthase [Lachnospiraceae bacterium]